MKNQAIARLTVQPMQEEDIARVEEIEAVSFPRCWPSGSFQNELRNNRVARYSVGKIDDRVVGYSGMWLILDEAHITTIAVDPQVRGQKIGKRILWHLLKDCCDRGARWAVLEVRSANQVAVDMYKVFGFKQIGTRKGYYDDEDDALVMWLGQMQSKDFSQLMDLQAREWHE